MLSDGYPPGGDSTVSGRPCYGLCAGSRAIRRTSRPWTAFASTPAHSRTSATPARPAHGRDLGWEVLAALNHYHGSEIQDQEYWRLFADAWTGCDTPMAKMDIIRPLMDSNRSDRDHVMTEDERSVLAALPDEITIYRGGNADDKGAEG